MKNKTMKTLAKIFGFFLTLVSLLLVLAAVVDLSSGHESPGMLVGMIIFWGLGALIGILIIRRGFRAPEGVIQNGPSAPVRDAEPSETIADLQPNVVMTNELRSAAMLMADGKYEETIAAYSAIADQDPSSVGVCHSQIGAAHYFLGQYETAIKHYEIALQNGANESMMNDNIVEAREAIAAG